MATLNILPNADVVNSPAWTIGTGSDVYAVLDDDDTGHVGSDSSDIEATAINKNCVVNMDDIDTGVTINSVQGVVKHNNRGRGSSYTIEVKILHSGGTYYGEDISGSGSADWQTATLTSRTTSDGSNAWTPTQVNNLQMGLKLTAISGGTVGITYAYLIIDYTAAVSATDNATFFGANF